MKKSPNVIVLIIISLISCVIIVGSIILFIKIPIEKMLEIAQIVGTVTASLAAVWFAFGLWLQAKQLNDQKKQFLESYKYMRQDAKRNTLQYCSEILENTMDKIYKSYPEIQDILQITKYYMDFSEIKVILESNDPHFIIENAQNWFRKEAPARILMNNLNFAALIYFDSVGIPYAKKKDPEESFYINGTVLREVPIFQEYCGVGEMLSNFMFTLKPARESTLFAYSLSMALTLPLGIIKIDNLNNDYKRLCEKNYPIPAIWSEFKKTFEGKKDD